MNGPVADVSATFGQEKSKKTVLRGEDSRLEQSLVLKTRGEGVFKAIVRGFRIPENE